MNDMVNESETFDEHGYSNIHLTGSDCREETRPSEMDLSTQNSGISQTNLSGSGSSLCSACCSRNFPKPFWPELKELLKMALPIVLCTCSKIWAPVQNLVVHWNQVTDLTIIGVFAWAFQFLLLTSVLIQLSQFMLGPVALMFTGRLGKTELDAASMANSMMNVTAISVASGLATACDTFFSQTFGNDKSKLGAALQKGLLLISLCVLPCLAIHLNMENILLGLGQDAEVSRLASNYLLIMGPGIVAYFIYMSFSKYLLNQNVIIPNLLIGLAVNTINVILQFVFVLSLNYGIYGSAIAQMVSYVGFLVFTVLYILISKIYEDTWGGWSTDCLSNWGEFYKLSLYGLFMTCIEWWSFEIGILLAGLLGKTDLGAQAVVFQLDGISYMLSLGVGIVASIRVGQALGAGDVPSAVTSVNVSLTLIVISGTFVGVLYIALKDILPLIFTNVTEIVSLTATILPILGVYMVFNSISGVCAGIIRGSGRQHLGAVIVAVCYACALSVGVPLMFLTDLRVRGYWIALAAALSVVSIVYLVIIYKADWERDVQYARERTATLSTLREDEPNPDSSNKVRSDIETNRLLASDEGIFQYNTLSEKKQTKTLDTSVKIKVFFVVSGFITVFIIGVLCRVYIPVREDASNMEQQNATVTTYLPDITMI